MPLVLYTYIYKYMHSSSSLGVGGIQGILKLETLHFGIFSAVNYTSDSSVEFKVLVDQLLESAELDPSYVIVLHSIDGCHQNTVWSRYVNFLVVQ